MLFLRSKALTRLTQAVPSNITYVTPNHSIGSLRPQDIKRSQQTGSEEERSPTKSELELLWPTINVSSQFDFEERLGPLAPHFRVLRDRLKDISCKQLISSCIDLSKEQQDATIESISNVFQDFTKACLNTAGTALLNGFLSNYLDLPSMFQEIRRDMRRSTAWRYPNRVYLPVLHCQAQFAIASGSYGQAEVVIDRLLAEHESFYGADRQQFLQRAIPTILLLGKAYLAQKKFYLLERLHRTWLSDVDCIQEIDKEVLAMHKLLFLVCTLVLAPDHNPCPLGKQDYQSMTFSSIPRLLDILVKNDNQENEILWAIGLVERLRYHYACWYPEKGKLVPLLERMQPLLKKAVPRMILAGEGKAPCLINHAVDGLLESYELLGMHTEKLEWQRFVSCAWGLNTLVISCDMTTQRQTEQTEIDYTTHLMGPLFTEFLGQWPPIALPSISKGDDPFLGIWFD